MEDQAQELPGWVTAVLTLVGGGGAGAAIMFVINQYFRFKKGVQELKTDETKSLIDAQRATEEIVLARHKAEDELDQTRENNAVAKWQGIAEKAMRDASTANDRANLEREVFDRRLDEVRKQYKEDLVHYQSREDALRGRWQEREIQFQEIIDEVRRSNDENVKSLNTKVDILNQQHAECIAESNQMKGELLILRRQYEEDREEHRKELEEIRTQLNLKRR